jgi:hypothetical protein
MDKADIELWRVGAVSCQWLSDWRRIRIVSGAEILSDQLLASPSEALSAARELRAFFKSLDARAEPERASEAAVS